MIDILPNLKDGDSLNYFKAFLFQRRDLHIPLKHCTSWMKHVHRSSELNA